MTISEVIKTRRKELKLKLKELSSKANITSVQLTNIEKGRCVPLPKTTYKLAIALDLDYSYLLNLTV